MGIYPSGHENPAVAAVIFLLDDWLNAMEAGTAHLRLPDPEYRRPNRRPFWTEEQMEVIVRDIDAEIDQEVSRAPGTSVGARAGPGFSRLALPQRLALVEQLETLLDRHRSVLGASTDATAPHDGQPASEGVQSSPVEVP